MNVSNNNNNNRLFLSFNDYIYDVVQKWPPSVSVVTSLTYILYRSVICMTAWRCCSEVTGESRTHSTFVRLQCKQTFIIITGLFMQVTCYTFIFDQQLHIIMIV